MSNGASAHLVGNRGVGRAHGQIEPVLGLRPNPRSYGQPRPQDRAEHGKADLEGSRYRTGCAPQKVDPVVRDLPFLESQGSWTQLHAVLWAARRWPRLRPLPHPLRFYAGTALPHRSQVRWHQEPEPRRPPTVGVRHEVVHAQPATFSRGPCSGWRSVTLSGRSWNSSYADSSIHTSMLVSPIEARILDHEDADAALDIVGGRHRWLDPA